MLIGDMQYKVERLLITSGFGELKMSAYHFSITIPQPYDNAEQSVNCPRSRRHMSHSCYPSLHGGQWLAQGALVVTLNVISLLLPSRAIDLLLSEDNL